MTGRAIHLGVIPLAISLVAGAELRAQRPVFSARAELVEVDALVTANRRPIPGLGREDFEIRDNGVLQTVDFVSFDERPVNVVLALDLSASVAGDKLVQLRQAGRMVLRDLRRSDRAALLTFSQAVIARSLLTEDVGKVQTALDAVSSSGETSLIDGTYAALTLGELEEGRTLAIVFSDGLDSASWLTSELVLEASRRSSVVLYAVASVGRAAPFLRDISSATGGRVLEVGPEKKMDATFAEVLAEFRHRYLLGYTPRGVAPDGWHKLEVRVRTRQATVRARPGYTRSTSPAARWPLTTALSIVPGRPVSIQSPAR